MTAETHPVFVYGTLKRGYLNHTHLRTANFVGRHRTLQRYPLVILAPWEMPCLYPCPGLGHIVTGEVFEVDEPTLEALDRLEWVGEPDGYLRDRIEVRPATRIAKVRSCWTYFKAGRSPELAAGPYLRSYQETRYRARNQPPSR